MTEATSKRGRPRIYSDDAARSAAYRERQAAQADTGEMLLYLWNKPTPGLIQALAAKYAAHLEDKAAAGANLAVALATGLQAGGGENCAEAAVNYFKFEHKRGSN